MKILHINHSDTQGGASIAAFRLHKAMLDNGLDSYFFCKSRTIHDDERDYCLTETRKNLLVRIVIRIKRIIKNRLPFRLKLSQKKGLFSNMLEGKMISSSINLNQFDVIYIHWINGNFLSLKGLEEICKTGKQIFWFMHDMFPITGGCHYSFECQNYKNHCGNCPYLAKCGKKDFSFKQFKLKKKIFSKYKNLNFISPSKWLYECAKSSGLTKNNNVYHIPNLLDSNIYKPMDKVFCRNALNISADKKVILFGADSALNNPYKGFEFIKEALEILSNDGNISKDELLLVIFGSSYNKAIDDLLPFETKFIGRLHDNYALSLLYNCADVFCIPSLAENFPNTVMESLHCKIPVVGFNIGGIPDLVCEDTGYLANYRDAEDFAKGIKKVLFENNKFTFKSIDKFSTKTIIKIHKRLFIN